MFRSAGKFFGGAAGLAASGPAVASWERAQPPRRLNPFGQEELRKRGDSGQKSHDPAELGEEWLVTDLRHALDEDLVIFGDEELEHTMQCIFGNHATDARSQPRQPAVRITEIDGEEGEEAALDEASEYMRLADLQMTPRNVQDDFNSILSSVLRNKEVQKAFCKAMKNDQTFQALLDSPHSTPIQVPVQDLVPSRRLAEVQAGERDSNIFVELIMELASGIKAVGGNIAQTAAGAKNLIGKLFIELGSRLHEVLGQPFSSPPVDKASSDENPWVPILGNAIIKVACAVFTLIILKRVNLIRFA